jgi:hypothetical protein
MLIVLELDNVALVTSGDILVEHMFDVAPRFRLVTQERAGFSMFCTL